MTRGAEARALLALVRGDESIDSHVDWDRLASLAEVHGVVPLLAQRVDQVPGSTAEWLHDASAWIAVRNLAALQQLLLVSELLRAEGVRPVATKGPALALRAYGDVSRRSFSDLDILVARAEARDAIRVLERSGYASEIETSDEQQLARSIRVRHEVMFAFETGLPVEIHWAIAPYHSVIEVSTDDMVRRAVTTAYGKRTLEMLAKEDEVVYLAAHASKHHWERLAWIVDLDRAVRTGEGLDWTSVVRVAREGRAMRGLRVGCYLAWMLLHAEWVPRTMAAIGADRQSWHVAVHLADRLFEEGEDAEHEPEQSLVRQDFYLRDGIGDRAKLVWRTLTTPTEREIAQSRGSVGAVVARIRRVFARAGVIAYRRLLHSPPAG